MSSERTTDPKRAQRTPASAGQRHAVERAREVEPQVVDVLEADAEAEQAVRDARRLPRGRVDEPVREPGRMLDQRVGRAQADGGRDEPYGLHHDRGGLPAPGDLEREHGAGPSQLDAVGLGVEHALDGRMAGEQAGERLRSLLRGAHTEGQRRQAPVEQIRGQGVEQRPGEDPDLPQPTGPVRVARDRPGDDVAVASEELRRAVQRQRGAVPGRVLQDRGGEGVVDEHGHVTCGRDGGGDVDLAEGRVLRRLEQDEARLGPDRRSDPVGRPPR